MYLDFFADINRSNSLSQFLFLFFAFIYLDFFCKYQQVIVKHFIAFILVIFINYALFADIRSSKLVWFASLNTQKFGFHFISWWVF